MQGRSLISPSVFRSLKNDTCITKRRKRGSVCIKVEGGGVRIDDFINISLRPNYFIFIGYLKTGGGGGGGGGVGEGLKRTPSGSAIELHLSNAQLQHLSYAL